MPRKLFILVTALLCMASCTRVREDYSSFDKALSIIFDNPVTPRSAWEEEDSLTIFNDADDRSGIFRYADAGTRKFLVPGGTKKIYAVYPVCTGTKEVANINIPQHQNQNEAGKLNGRNFPIYSTSHINNGRSGLEFSSAAVAWAFNVINSGFSGTEKLLSISLKPNQNSFLGYSVLNLTNPKPADLKGDNNGPAIVTLREPCALNSGAVYICTYKGIYDGLEIIVNTNLKSYSIKADSRTIDCRETDIVNINIDLSDGSADFVVSGTNSEIFTESDYPADPMTPLGLDFSRIGYHYGETGIPEYSANVIYLDPIGNGSNPANDEIIDRTADIQNALDKVRQPGSVILRAGRYYVSEKIYIKRNSIILRGEVNSSVSEVKTRNLSTIIGTKKDCAAEKPRMIILGQNPKTITEGEPVNIVGEHVPEGCLYVRVTNPEKFTIGDRIFICRPDNADWSHDLGMDHILSKDGSEVYSWNDYDYKFDIKADRIVTDIQGNKLFLDNPIPMALDLKYGQSYVCKYSCTRIKECGVEDLNFDNLYDPTVTSTQCNHHSESYKIPEYPADENHFWDAIRVSFAEHCWVRNITATHFTFAAVSIYNSSRNISVLNCHSYAPVSIINSPRRYAFAIGNAQLCLFKDCTCDQDRHQFVTTGVGSIGPHAFVNCKATNAWSNAGPHSHWATFVLYDNVVSDKELTVEDLQYSGYASGAQGWQGANHVFWNCKSPILVCQSPQVSAANWAWGCIGEKRYGMIDRTQNEGDRPDGQWQSLGTEIAPVSLYFYQLEQRLSQGISLNNFYQNQ